jgi:transcription antitermination factor NusG
MSFFWGLLRLNPASQPRFLDHVSSTYPDIPTYQPLYPKTTRPAKKRHPITIYQPVYPGYLFAQILDDKFIHRLTSTPVRAYFVRFGGKIGTVPDSVILELRRLESLNQLVQEEQRKDPYAPGTRVIIHLPMSDIRGIIQMTKGTRAIVETPLCKVIVPIHQVGLV